MRLSCQAAKKEVERGKRHHWKQLHDEGTKIEANYNIYIFFLNKI